MNTLIEANLSCLQQGIGLLEVIPGDLYTKKCNSVFGSSIGGHFRHNIDHYLAFQKGFEQKQVDYDARRRDHAIEQQPDVARDAMAGIVDFFNAISGETLDTPMKIRMDDGGDATWSQSSLRRELQFLLSHTIHHYALVVSIATQQAYSQFPDGFGIAPSTLHHREKTGA